MNDEKTFEDVKKKLDRIEKINNFEGGYLVKLLGIGAGVADLTVPGIGVAFDGIKDLSEKIIQDSLIKKRKELMEIIMLNKELITVDMIDESFIVELANTIRVVDRLATNDKVKYIGNLFRNTFCCDLKANIDEYEEWLQNLNQLSYRQIQILKLLYDNEQSYKEKEVYVNFYKEVEEKFEIEREETESILTSASKSGFCREKVGAILGYKGGEFYTTDYFKKFIERIC